MSGNDIGQQFCRAMRQLPGGVCVVTVNTDNQRTGMVTNSLMPVSVDPPELLIAVNRSSSTGLALTDATHFGIGILKRSQQQTASHFSGFSGLKGVDRFRDQSWHQTGDHRVWLLSHALASFSCRITKTLTHQQHTLVIGQVTQVESDPTDLPLAYWDGGYGFFQSNHD